MPKTQLKMLRHLHDELPPLIVPEGYSLRTYEGPDDDDAWVHIMNNSLGNRHTVESFRAGILNCPQFTADILFFACFNGSPVGSACAWRRTVTEHRAGYVHMVGLVPEHRSKGIGRLLVLRTLHSFRQRRFEAAELNTDDFRLPAIRTYLGLGFLPVMTDSDHPERWAAVFKNLTSSSLR